MPSVVKVTLAGTVSRITSSRHLYLVEGREVGTGSDGEPCLADATAERLQDRVFIKNLQDDSLKVAGIGKNPPGKPETVYPERSNGWALNPDQRGENVAPSLAQLLPEELKPSS
jgi:hypothetical protein